MARSSRGTGSNLSVMTSLAAGFGILFVSLSFMRDVGDFRQGLLAGCGIGMLVLAVIFFAKSRV